MKRILAAGAILALCCTVGWASGALAADKGARRITESTIDPAKTPKPATPSRTVPTRRGWSAQPATTARMPDGKRIDYVEGQKIENANPATTRPPPACRTS